MKINDTLIGNYLYGDLPITISGINEKGVMHIQISDDTTENCVLHVIEQGKDCLSALTEVESEAIRILTINNFLYIENMSVLPDGNVAIYDVAGRLMWTEALRSTMEIDIGRWQSGIYFVFARVGGVVRRHKVVKF